MQIGQRILICGSDDAEEDVKSVMTSLSQNEFLRNWFTFLSITGNGSWGLDVLIGKGFRPHDRLVLLLGDKYGQTVSDGVSMPQFICQSAADSNIERLVFVKSTDAADERQKAFLDSVSAQVVRARYRTSSDAVKSVLSSLVASLRNEFDELARAGRLPPYDPEKLHDLICQQLVPDKKGETFDLNVSLDDLDQNRLAHFIEPANRYLQKNGRKPLTDLEFLKQHNFADADGRIYDLAFYLFAKTSFCSPVEATKPRKRTKTIIAIPRSREETGFIYTDDIAPDLADTTELYDALREDAKNELKQEQADAEALKATAEASVRRMEKSLERDLQTLEAAESIANDETIAELTRQAFLHIHDELQKVFVPIAKKYGETEEPEYLTAYSLKQSLKRICRIRNRNSDRLDDPCDDLIQDFVHFIETPVGMGYGEIVDGVPDSYQALYKILMPETEKEKNAKKNSAPSVDGKVIETLAELKEGQQNLLNGQRAIKGEIKDTRGILQRFFDWIPRFFTSRAGVSREQVENAFDLEKRYEKLNSFTNADHKEQIKALIRYSLKHPIDKNEGGRLYEDMANKTIVPKAIDDLFKTYGKVWEKRPNAWRNTKKDKKAFAASAYGLMKDPDKDPFRHE